MKEVNENRFGASGRVGLERGHVGTIRALAMLAALTLSGAVAVAARPVPSAALRLRIAKGPDIIGIVHWGLNTYTDREWGYGDENPAMLMPKAFDAGQIAESARAGGIGGLVVVAKHHDGFCLWPTKTTEHNISKSPFRGGKGDYVREMSDACRHAGIKFGVYCSPWDRNNADYGTARYVETFHAQIRELLGGAYGEVFEMWFDGANGGDGWYGGAKEKRKIGRDYYKFGEVFRFVRELQPNVAIFAGERDDSDYRWPGNERGELDPDSRATVVSLVDYFDGKYVNPEYRKQINTGAPDGDRFRMCEADFPLRKGWFYHDRDRGTTKGPLQLLKRYLTSVGNGGIMNIGLAPNRDGVLDADDVRSLAGFTALRNALFAEEAAPGEPFNVVDMRENLANGEQVDGWSLMADGVAVLSGRAIGARRIRVLDKPVSAKKVELRVTADGGSALPVTVKRYMADPELAALVLGTAAAGAETDTAKWMTGLEKEANR